jgi:hypothetical protein
MTKLWNNDLVFKIYRYEEIRGNMREMNFRLPDINH